MLGPPIAFFYQHNSMSFKRKYNYLQFMDGETKALNEPKD